MSNTSDSILGRSMAHMDRIFREVKAARKAGKELITVLCGPDTQPGDILKTVPHDVLDEEDCPEEDKVTVKVIAAHDSVGLDRATMQMYEVREAICIILEPGDITTEEEFAGLYAEEDEDTEEDPVEEDVEPQDPNVCACGANKEMCERNQNVFGGHLSDQN